MNVIIRDNVTLQCSVNESGSSGGRGLNLKWLLGNNSLSDTCENGETSTAGKYAFHHDNQSCSLTIRHLELSDEGNYRCEVHDSFITRWNDTYLYVDGR